MRAAGPSPDSRPRLVAFFLVLGLPPLPVPAQTEPSPVPPPLTASSPSVPAAPQSALDRLTQNNHDLLELLKKQQAVLEDIQYDRRLQSRQFQLLEERMEETLQKNAELQSKIASLEATIAAGPQTPATPPPNSTNATTATQPPPPSTYLPAPESEGAPGAKSWHRLFTLSGEDSKTTDLFHVQGRQWRVLWHNQDKPGASYQNTSALFINAFPKDDTIPQKVCSKLGSGGDSAELDGPGNYFLKVEASGGSWELAVEDFR